MTLDRRQEDEIKALAKRYQYAVLRELGCDDDGIESCLDKKDHEVIGYFYRSNNEVLVDWE